MTLDEFLALTRDTAQGASNAAASTVAVPVDLLSWGLGALGVPGQDRPVGGTRWMTEVGLMREPESKWAGLLGEVAGGVVPGLLGAKAPVVASGLLRAADDLAAPGVAHGSREAMRGGPISAEGKARLLDDLRAGEGSGRYRLGDVTEGQRKGLDALFGRESAARDVYMTDDAFRHIMERRLQDQGFSPEDVTRFVEQAMARRARPDIDPAKSNNNPSLLGPLEIDQATGRRYEPRLPLRQSADGYEPRSIVPQGLRPRKQ